MFGWIAVSMAGTVEAAHVYLVPFNKRITPFQVYELTEGWFTWYLQLDCCQGESQGQKTDRAV